MHRVSQNEVIRIRTFFYIIAFSIFPDPDWASINLGVLICIECSGVHRQLGSHISRVRSLDLDEWPPGHLAVMTSLGNRLANAIWEANLPRSGARKPEPNSSQEEKERYIVAKYSRKEFLAPLPSGMTAVAALLDGICRYSLTVFCPLTANQTKNQSFFRSDVKSVPLALAHASQEDVNSPISPRDARTPLHVASSLGSLSIVQLLIWVSTKNHSKKYRRLKKRCFSLPSPTLT